MMNKLLYSVTRKMETESAHFLPGHPGLCGNLHGHTYRWEVRIFSGELKDDMVIDFGDLKKIMNDTIGRFDHAIIVPKESSGAYFLSTQRVVAMPCRPTAERMAADVFEKIKKILEEEYPHLSLGYVSCRETSNNEATCYGV
jgi:6-pyruvoyltetrahydropterin/6-carboxytetrahydropterin synthase